MKLGDSWGAEEELLHPRGKNGRWISKAGVGMLTAVAKRIKKLLDSIDFRTFQSDQQASQYLFNDYKDWPETDKHRLLSDLGETNARLRAGKMDPSTQQFIDMMDRQLQPADSDLILHRTVGPEAFGIDPALLDAEDGGIWDFQGKLVGDRGYTATRLGTPGTGKPIHIAIVAPKGTKMAPTRNGPGDRGVMLDREAPVRITRVERDGQGGYHVNAIIDHGAEHGTPIAPLAGPERSTMTPEAREARIAEPSRLPGPRKLEEQDRREAARVAEVERRQGAGELEPSPVGPTDTGPNGPPPRNEPVVTESVGGGPSPQAPTAPGGGAPEGRPEPIRAVDLRDAVRDANIESPSAGPRRRAFNGAYLDVLTGKKNSVDTLRELESDINVSKRLRERIKAGEEKPDPELDNDIKSLEQLADVIAENQGIERFKAFKEAPAIKAKPQKSTQEFVDAKTKDWRDGIIARDAELSKVEGYPRSPVEERVQDYARAIRGEKEIVRPAKEKPRHPMARKPVVKGAPAKKAVKAIPTPTKVVPKGPATKLGRRTVADLTPDEKVSLVVRHRQLKQDFAEYPRNDDEQEIQDLALEILGEKPAPAKKVAPAAPVKAVKKAAPAKTPSATVRKAQLADQAKLLRERAVAAGDIDKMTKDELLADPRAEGVPKSWTKDKIKAHIRGETPAPVKRAPAKKAAPAVSPDTAKLREEGLGGTAEELRLIANQEGVPRRGRPTNKAGLIQAIRKRRAEVGDRKEAPELAAPKPSNLLSSKGLAGIRDMIQERRDKHPTSRSKAMSVIGEELGYDGKPTVVSRQEMDKLLADGGLELHRGVRTDESGSAESHAEGFRSGPIHYAPGTKGSGVYFTTKEEDARKYARKDGVLLRATPKKDARVISIDEIRQMQEAEKARAGADWPRELNDEGVFASALGYDVMTLGRSGEVSVLNRKAVAVERGGEGPLPEGRVTPRAPEVTPEPIVQKSAGDIDQDEMLTLRDLSFKARFTENGWVNRTDLPPDRARHLDALAEKGWIQKKGDLFRISPESVGAQGQGTTPSGALQGDVLPALRETPGRLSLQRLQPGAIVAGYKDPANPGKFTRVPETGEVDPARVIRVRIQRQELVDKDGKPTKALLTPWRQVTGHDVETNERVRSDTVSAGSYWDWEMNPEEGVSPDIEGEATEIPERRAINAPPIVQNPVAQRPITTPDRKSSFDEAWDAKGFEAPQGSANRSLQEIREDISTGKITPDEGIRRLETEINLNSDEMIQMDQDLRGDLEPMERDLLLEQRKELGRSIRAQADASKFIRSHFKKEPEVTPDEVKAVLVDSDSPEARNLGERMRAASPAEVRDMKRQIKEEHGFEVEGDNGEEVFDNALKKIIERELASREAKKKAPDLAPAPKAPDKPKPNLEESKYQRLDSRALAEGLDLRDPHDVRMLDQIQKMLDGDDDRAGKNATPAQVGRYLEQWNNGPAGPNGNSRITRSILTGDSPEKRAEVDAKADRLKARGDEWKKLADRLMNTRRQPKRDPVPDVEPKVTRDEKKDIGRVAEVTGIPAQDLEKAALRKKQDEAPPKQSAVQVVGTLDTIRDRDEARTLLKGRTKPELLEILKAAGFKGPIKGSKATKQDILDDVVEGTVGRRIDSEATRGFRGVSPGTGETLYKIPETGMMTRKDLMDADLEELTRIENNLGIKRTSLNREDRVNAIIEKAGGLGRGPEPPTPGGGAPAPGPTRGPGQGVDLLADDPDNRVATTAFTAAAALPRPEGSSEVAGRRLYHGGGVGPNGDEALHSITQQQGFGAPATRMSKKDMDAGIRQGNIVMYRGVREREGKSATEMHEQVLSGEPFYGLGFSGNGYYFSSESALASQYGQVGRYALHRDAKVIDFRDLQTEQERYLDSVGRDSIAGRVYSDPGRYAAARGYDAIRWKRGEEGGQRGGEEWIVVNRGALILESEGGGGDFAAPPPPGSRILSRRQLEKLKAQHDLEVAKAKLRSLPANDTKNRQRAQFNLEDAQVRIEQRVKGRVGYNWDSPSWDEPSAYVVKDSPTQRALDDHVEQVVAKLPSQTRPQAHEELTRQGKLTPKSMLELRAVEEGFGGYTPEDPNSYAVYDSNFHTIKLSSKWSNPHGRDQFLASYEFGGDSDWHSPTRGGAIQGIVAHEYGHHLAYRVLGLPRVDQAKLIAAIDENLDGQGFLIREFRKGRSLEDVVSEFVQFYGHGRIDRHVSGYARKNYQEFLAEIWAEYSTMGQGARSASEEIGVILRALAEKFSIIRQ